MAITIQSSVDILTEELGVGYSNNSVFIAEKIIQEYIQKVPEVWDDTLSLATARLYTRMSLDNGISRESHDTHDVTYTKMTNTQELLGSSILSLLDPYRLSPTTESFSGSFTIL